MSLPQVLDVLKARWLSGLTVLGLVVGIVLVATLLQNKQYTALATVLLDIRTADPLGGTVVAGNGTTNYMATQVGVVRSERVALRALQLLGLDRSEDLRLQWQQATTGAGDFRAWLAQRVLSRLDVTPLREGSILHIEYTSPDPGFSAAMANAIVKAYTDTSLELRVEPARQYNAFFDERAVQLRTAVDQAQTRLSKRQRELGIVASDARLDVENARLAELSSLMVALQAGASESQHRQSQAQANPERAPEVLANTLLSGLSAEAARHEARLLELRTRLGEAHPQVREAEASLAHLREQLVSQTRRITGSVGVNNAVNQSRVAQVRRDLEAQRNKLLQLTGHRDEFTVLQRDLENAQRAYDAVMLRSSQSSMESKVTQTNVSQLQQATPPVLPSSPRLLLNLAAAFSLGAVLALSTVLLRERFDRRLRSEEDVLVALKQAVVGVLPRHSRPGREGQTRLRLLGVLPARRLWTFR